MMGIGFGEMALIAGIALVVIGPEKFPDFAKIVVKTIRDLRGYVDDVKHELAEELKPIKKEMNQLSRYDAEKYIDALTSPDKDASGPKDHVSEPAASPTEDPYAFNADYGYEYQDYNPEVPGGAVTEADETSEAAIEEAAEAEPTAEAAPDTNPPSPKEDDVDGFDIQAPERID